MNSNMVDYKGYPYESNEQCGGHSSDLADTLRILKEEIRNCKTDNDRIIREQKEQAKFNAIRFQSCKNCSDKGHFRSTMDRRKKVMGHMVVGILVDTGWIALTR